MPARVRISSQLRVAAALCGLMLLGTGCQTWRSASAIPSLSATKSERKIVAQAKNDPFPSPADVGLTVKK